MTIKATNIVNSVVPASTFPALMAPGEAPHGSRRDPELELARDQRSDQRNHQHAEPLCTQQMQQLGRDDEDNAEWKDQLARPQKARAESRLGRVKASSALPSAANASEERRRRLLVLEGDGDGSAAPGRD